MPLEHILMLEKEEKMSKYITKPIFYSGGQATTVPTPTALVYEIGSSVIYYYTDYYYPIDSEQKVMRDNTYKQMLEDEGHLVDQDKTTINKMLESTDMDTVKLAVEIVKNKTKFLGCYLESLWVIKSIYLQQQILELYKESKHGRL